MLACVAIIATLVCSKGWTSWEVVEEIKSNFKRRHFKSGMTHFKLQYLMHQAISIHHLVDHI